MADPTNVIQHDFGFPQVIRAEEAERVALYAMLASLGATKMMAEQLMQDYPQHRMAAQFIVDFASDGESDMRGAIANMSARSKASPMRCGPAASSSRSIGITPSRGRILLSERSLQDIRTASRSTRVPSVEWDGPSTRRGSTNSSRTRL
jgi:hypothetical protein